MQTRVFFLLLAVASIAFAPPSSTASAQENGSISCGQTVQGNINEDGSAELWTFDVAPGTLVTISAEAADDTALDLYMELYSVSGTYMFSNDDGGEGYNSRIADFWLPLGGSYEIAMTSWGNTDEYTLSLSCSDESPGQLIQYGQALSGAINDDQPAYSYVFEGRAGDEIAITMADGGEGTLDSTVFLFGPDGALIGQDDDSGGGLTGFDAALWGALPADGTYRLTLTRFGGESYGDFAGSLDLTSAGEAAVEAPAEEAAAVEIDVDEAPAEETPALLTLEDLYILLESGQYEEGQEVTVEGFVGFFDILADALEDAEEVTEMMEVAAGDMPYYLYDETLIETNLGFAPGTYLPFDLPQTLGLEEYLGARVEVTGVVEEAPDLDSNWVLRGRDVQVIGGDAVSATQRTHPGLLQAPGTAAINRAAPGAQGTGECQYGIVLVGRPNLLVAITWPPVLSDRYENDAVFAVRVLRAMGVPAGNIQVALSSRPVRTPLDGTGVAVTQAGTMAGMKAAVTATVNSITPRLESGESCTLYLITSDHGGGLDMNNRLRKPAGGRLGRLTFPAAVNIQWPKNAGGLVDGAGRDPSPNDESDNVNEANYKTPVRLPNGLTVDICPNIDGNGVASIANIDETLIASDGKLRDDAFAALFAGLPAPGDNFRFYVLMEQCFSGGFLDELKDPVNPIVTNIATAAAETETSKAADTEGPYDEFLFHFLSALAGQNPYGVAVNADTNGDGNVTWQEAFEYARPPTDNQAETPQFR